MRVHHTGTQAARIRRTSSLMSALAMLASMLAIEAARADGIVAQLTTPPTSSRVRFFDLGPAGFCLAEQVAKTPGVWEGLAAQPDPRGMSQVFAVQTTHGELVVVHRAGGGVVHAVPLGNGLHIVHTQDSALPGCAGALAPPVPAGAASEGSLASGCGDPRRIDVLMRWTSTAQSAAGGAGAISSIAEASIAISNHVYALSGLDVRLNAVHMGPVGPYSGDAGGMVLFDLAQSGDGKMDSVHADRNTYGADLVALLTGTHPEYCGVAFLGGTGDASRGFSVTVWHCAAGNLTFTHEIGHNQGCCHAPGDGGGCNSGGLFPYSVGNRFHGESGELWRTVMAYSPGGRIARLSSPLVRYDNSPTGFDTADNARTVSETAEILSSWRCSLDPDPSIMRHVDLPALPVPLHGAEAVWTQASVPPAVVGTRVELEVSAIADLGGMDEYLSLRINSTDLGLVAGHSGFDCDGVESRFVIPASLFNGALADEGPNTFALTSSDGVTMRCSMDEVRMSARYWADPSWGGIVRCWGNRDDRQCPPPNDIGLARAVASGGYHTISIAGNDLVRCWGANWGGQCDVPDDLGRVTRVAAGGYHSVALTTGRMVRCWGANTHGQSAVPSDLGECLRIGAGYQHTIALRTDGSVACWGDDYHGQSSVPPQLGTAIEIDAGGEHSLAVRADGSVRCWGWNHYGQCTPPSNLGAVIKVAGGHVHSAAIRPNGTLRCWGWNGLGQCSVPGNLGPVIDVAAGSDHTIALLADGSVRSWGSNQFGQSQVPSSLRKAVSVSAGYFFTVVVERLPVPCVADLNGDGVVDGLDMGFVLSAWGQPDTTSIADIDGDGTVSGLDLSVILSAWGSC